MLFWLALAVAVAWLLWYMVWVPGASYSGPLMPLSEAERELESRLRRHVAAIASREHNLEHPEALESAAQEIEAALAGVGYEVGAQRFASVATEVRNIEVEIAGGTRGIEIVEIGRASCRERV